MSWLVTDSGLRWDPGTEGLTALPDHTELNGAVGWVVPGGNGIYEVRPGGRIVSKALEDSGVGKGAYIESPVFSSTGHYIISTLTCANWTGKPMGLKVHHIVGGSYSSVDGRLGTGAWDIRTDTTVVLSGSVGTGIPNATFGAVDVGFGWKANLGLLTGVGIIDGRFGFAVNQLAGSRQNVMAEDAVPYTQIPSDNTYPGIVQHNAPIGSEWGTFTVYKDWALLFRFLQPGWGIKIDDVTYGTGTTFLTADVDGNCRWTVPIGINPPVSVGTQITLYSDAGTWLVPVPGGAITVGALDLDVGVDAVWPGAQIDWVEPDTQDRVGMLVNWENDDDWLSHDVDNVDADLVGVKIVQVAADPRIEVDTMLVSLRDPTGLYVPARVESDLYGLVRLDREVRWNVERNGIKVCRFHGKIKEYAPSLPHKTDVDRVQRCVMRVESPLRELADTELTLVTPPTGVLVAPDGSGVIADLLSLVPDIIPATTWLLSPTDVTPEAEFLTPGMSLQTALEQCAILADAVYGILPHYRDVPSPKFYFIWTPRTTGHATVDHTWSDTNGDISHLTPRFTGDDL